MDLRKKIETLAHKKRAKIGIGLLKTSPSVIRSLKKAQEFCDITVIGKKVAGFKHIPATQQTIEQVELKTLLGKKIQALIRGQADAFKFEDWLAKLGGYDRRNMPGAMLIIDAFERAFFTTSGSHPDGWTIRSKKMQIDELLAVVKSFGLTPKIGFRTLVRPGSVGRNWFFDQSWEQAEFLAQHYTKLGYQAKNYNIEIETAIADGVNLMVFSDGATGNIFGRAIQFFTRDPFMVYLQGGIKEIVIQNNRTLQDYGNHFLVAAAMVNRKN